MAVRFTSINQTARTQPDPYTDDMHLSERRWFAVRTASKHEKAAVRELRRRGIEAYIPLRERTYRYVSKEVVRELPLLTGYVFVNVHRGEERAVVSCQYVADFVRLGRARYRVKPSEMDLLRRISTDRELDWVMVENAFDFAAGTTVEIIRGPLAGTQGVYLDKRNKKTFLIALGSIDACLGICEVDPTMLVALDGAAPGGTAAVGVHEGKRQLW